MTKGAMRRAGLAAGLVAAGAVFAVPAGRAFAATGSVGYDISWPQCSGSGLGSVPSSPGAFTILGVNDGIVYSPNPCLKAERGWAGASPVSYYANTGNPGSISSHWPKGLTAHKHTCPNQSSYPVGSPAFNACSWLYGWYAAANSLSGAVAAVGTSARSAQWWLDIESANSWSTSTTANIDDITGALTYLTTHTTDLGKTGYVGLYTNSSSWSSITGSTTKLSSRPFWYPGATQSTAPSYCAGPSVTGGAVRYVQYVANNVDNDYDCG